MVLFWHRRRRNGSQNPTVVCGAVFGAIVIATSMAVDEPPPIPLGLDAYRQWSLWHQQRIGLRTYMRSTYDRSGGNEGADAVIFSIKPRTILTCRSMWRVRGCFVSWRTNHWHGSPWHYVVDGKDHLVEETSTRDPTKPVPNSVFIPEHLFPLRSRGHGRLPAGQISTGSPSYSRIHSAWPTREPATERATTFISSS
jgi:hypothetical protein